MGHDTINPVDCNLIAPLEFESMADPITGLLSKRSFVAAGDRWIPRAAKDGVPLAVAYLE
ncbi:MAG: hypothetical protein RLY86_3231, partial [Pseudomonadota bacterium]